MSFISYLTSTATSPYSKTVKSFFHRYFSFSNKVFYPVAYIMNELQHLTTPSSLKFCLALCFSSGPNSSKFGPSCPQVGSNFFHLAKEMATTFLEPERTLERVNSFQNRAINNIIRNLHHNIGIDVFGQCPSI